MATISIPSLQDVTPSNQQKLKGLQKQIGFIPNLYAVSSLSESALDTILALNGSRSSLDLKARELINLVVSQVNGCEYCLAAHTGVASRAGFGEDQILEIRRGRASFDSKLDALAKLVQDMVQKRGHADPALVRAFLDAGWNEGNLVDAIVVVGSKTIANYLHGTTQVPIDFPPAPALAV